MIELAKLIAAALPCRTTKEISCVADRLRDLLAEHVDPGSDSVAHLIPITSGSSYAGIVPSIVEVVQRHHTMTELAESVIRASATMGPERIAKLVESWAQGESRRLRMKAVLMGVAVGGGCELPDGIGLRTLPASSNELPESMPKLQDPVATSRILGCALLEVNATINPVFFTPTRDCRASAGRVSVALGHYELEMFILALSLVVGQRVEVAWTWTDHGDAAVFSEGERRGLVGPGIASGQGPDRSWSYDSRTGLVKLDEPRIPVANLDEQGLFRAWALLADLQRLVRSHPRFSIAVSRWMRAATPGVNAPDRAIDLRIALEALFLNSSGGELSFRLSATGARFLREGLDERKVVFRILRSFYELSSKTIHGSSDRGHAATGLVDSAAGLCGEGILKIVEQKSYPD